MVDMGMAGKIRPAVVVLDDAVDVERSLVAHIPITSQNKGTALEVPLGHLWFLTTTSVANIQAISSLPKSRFERKMGVLPASDMAKIKEAMRLAFGL